MENNIFKNIARKATTLSPLMANREKISIDDLISNYPEYVTVTQFDIITSGLDSFPVFLFAEDNTKFAFGGTVLHNIIEAWVNQFDGNIEETSEMLKNSGGVKMRFYKSRTKNGNNVTLVEPLD